MAFTTSCFVRVEDAEKRKNIIKQLESIGYLLNEKRGYVIVTDTSIRSVFVGMYSDSERRTGRIDCGVDTDLFLALASMRDDTDEGQCFVPAEGASLLCSKWIVCKEKQFKGESIRYDNRKYVAPRGHFRKAATEEIIEHFKNRKNDTI